MPDIKIENKIVSIDTLIEKESEFRIWLCSSEVANLVEQGIYGLVHGSFKKQIDLLFTTNQQGELIARSTPKHKNRKQKDLEKFVKFKGEFLGEGYLTTIEIPFNYFSGSQKPNILFIQETHNNVAPGSRVKEIERDITILPVYIHGKPDSPFNALTFRGIPEDIRILY